MTTRDYVQRAVLGLSLDNDVQSYLLMCARDGLQAYAGYVPSCDPKLAKINTVPPHDDHSKLGKYWLDRVLQFYPELFPEWARLMAQSRRVAPPELASLFLEQGNEHAKFRVYALELCGARAPWLATFNPKWKWVDEPLRYTLDEQVKQDVSPKELSFLLGERGLEWERFRVFFMQVMRRIATPHRIRKVLKAQTQ